MPWYIWVAISWLSLSAVFHIRQIDKPRKPVSREEACWNILMIIAIIVGLIVAYG